MWLYQKSKKDSADIKTLTFTLRHPAWERGWHQNVTQLFWLWQISCIQLWLGDLSCFDYARLNKFFLQRGQEGLTAHILDFHCGFGYESPKHLSAFTPLAVECGRACGQRWDQIHAKVNEEEKANNAIYSTINQTTVSTKWAMNIVSLQLNFNQTEGETIAELSMRWWKEHQKPAAGTQYRFVHEYYRCFFTLQLSTLPSFLSTPV